MDTATKWTPPPAAAEAFRRPFRPFAKAPPPGPAEPVETPPPVEEPTPAPAVTPEVAAVVPLKGLAFVTRLKEVVERALAGKTMVAVGGFRDWILLTHPELEGLTFQELHDALRDGYWQRLTSAAPDGRYRIRGREQSVYHRRGIGLKLARKRIDWLRKQPRGCA